jgi:nucleotide-binding universal stress UspA family protein
MLPLKKILCPTDFSEPSYVALNVANEFAVHFSAELILLHVVNPIQILPATGGGLEPSPALDFGMYLEEMETYAGKSLDELVQKKISGEMPVRPMVIQGDPASEIVNLAATEKMDVIVIATHGLTGWRRFIFGSVTEKVVRLAECPVLTIKEPRKEK